MHPDFSPLFHDSSKDLAGHGRVHIPQDDALWPQEWKTIYYKRYPRLPHIPLMRAPLKADFADALLKRKSSRDFDSTPISLDRLSSLLLYGAGKNGSATRRTYASGGGRYTIEIYPLVFAGSSELPAGVYHYDVRDHALDVLWQREFSAQDIADLFVYEWAQRASFALIMTATFWRDQVKYGERGYRYVLLEAGHVGENLYLTSSALDLKCCGMGGSLDETIENLLEIDGITESTVHCMVFGS